MASVLVARNRRWRNCFFGDDGHPGHRRVPGSAQEQAVLLGHARRGGALVSVGGNALHAILPATAPLPTALAFAVACVPPAGILGGSTHAVQILWRFNPSREMASSQPRRTVEVPVPADHDRGQRWLQLAREIHTRGRLTNHSETTLSQALWRLFEVRPQMSLRAIGEEVGVGHHDVIARIRQTATEVVRERPELVPMPVAIEGQPGLAS